jgi:hypothetical protein
VLDATSELLTAAVAHTPGINTTLQTFVHSGFWNSYCAVREFIHIKLRETLAEDPTLVFFTGHSLGGALATFAALDFTIHSLDRINRYVRHRKIRLTTLPPFLSLLLAPLILCHRLSPRAPPRLRQTKGFQDNKVAMYNFGSPKIGNWKFAQLYDRYLPNSFRVVTDGDIVCGLPPTMSYFHIGTEVLIDSQGAGTIIIDPSFVERRLRTRVATSFSVHAMSVYELGLDRILESSKLLFPTDSQSSEILPFDEAAIPWDPSLFTSTSSSNEEKTSASFVPLSQDSSHESEKDLEWNYKLDVSESNPRSQGTSADRQQQQQPPHKGVPEVTSSSSSSSSSLFSSLNLFQRFRMNEDEMSEILVSRVPRRVTQGPESSEQKQQPASE